MPTSDEYYTKIAVMYADGQLSWKEYLRYSEGCDNSEILEMTRLLDDLTIVEGSEDHIRLSDLYTKYVTADAMDLEIW